MYLRMSVILMGAYVNFVGVVGALHTNDRRYIMNN